MSACFKQFLKSTKISANLTLLDSNGREVAHAIQNITVRAGKSAQLKNVFNVANPKLWSPWSPDLYKLQVVLKDAAGKVIDGVAVKTGLRIF